jgi:hypothetical protein
MAWDKPELLVLGTSVVQLIHGSPYGFTKCVWFFPDVRQPLFEWDATISAYEADE